MTYSRKEQLWLLTSMKKETVFFLLKIIKNYLSHLDLTI